MPSIFTFAVLQKPCRGILGSLIDPAWVDLAVLKKTVNFWRFQNGWQHELARYYKRGKLVSYFQNHATKTCLYGLKISENIEIGHFFQSRTFFHLSSNLHTSCLSAFNKLGFGAFQKKKKGKKQRKKKSFLLSILVNNRFLRGKSPQQHLNERESGFTFFYILLL